MLSPDSVARNVSDDDKHALVSSLTVHLKSVNDRLEPHEKLDFLAIVITAWTPENGLVTPTLKVKRPCIEDAYASQYDALLAQRKPVVWVKI